MSKKKTIISILIGIIFLVIMFGFYTTFSLGENYRFESVVYSIKDGQIKDISPNTKIALFVDYFDLENCNIKVVNIDNEEIVSGYVTNGSKTILSDNNKKVIATYENIIIGDYDKNGTVDNKDLEGIGKNLLESSFNEDIIKSIDINQDEEIHLNDIILLDKNMNMDYKQLTLEKKSIILQSNELGRVGYTVVPRYGKNTNLKWTSSNQEVATVRESGAIIGNQEGDTIIKAETLDGKLYQEIAVKVDNTIQLGSYQGIIYVGGKEHSIFIKSIDYEGITCSSSNERSVSCRIDGKYLMLQGNIDGDAIITVTSQKYGSVEYKATAFSTYVNLFPSYGCSPINRTGSVTISTMLAGELIFEIADKDIITKAYVTGNQFSITAGEKTGRGEVIVRATNGTGNKKFILDVYNLDIPVIGKVGKVGTEIEADILAEGTGTLTCKSPNEEIATCRVEGKKLYVMPHKKGEVLIEVANTIEFNGNKNKCGTTTFLAVIQE